VSGILHTCSSPERAGRSLCGDERWLGNLIAATNRAPPRWSPTVLAVQIGFGRKRRATPPTPGPSGLGLRGLAHAVPRGSRGGEAGLAHPRRSVATTECRLTAASDLEEASTAQRLGGWKGGLRGSAGERAVGGLGGSDRATGNRRAAAMGARHVRARRTVGVVAVLPYPSHPATTQMPREYLGMASRLFNASPGAGRACLRNPSSWK
jgi:hypothetical protein